MIRYLARRVVMTIITLFGVTVVVFLLGRLLPSPMFDDSGASATDDAQRWQEARYGLDQSLVRQYCNWWRGMVIIDHDVLLWTNEATPRAIYQRRAPSPGRQFVARDGGGAWERADIDDDALENIQILQGDALVEFTQRLSWRDREAIERTANGKTSLAHAQVHCTFGGEDDIAGDIVVERASIRRSQFAVTLGRSRLTNATVMDDALRRLPISITIGMIALFLIYTIGPLLGVLAGARSGSAHDRVIGGGILFIWSIPMAVSATVLYGISGAHDTFMNSIVHDAELLPWLLSWIARAALPAIVLALPGAAYVARQVRASVAEQMQSAYVQTAFAKGCSRREVVVRHVLRPSMLVVVTMAATTLPVIIGGSVIVESVFGIDGMGRYLYQAAIHRDYDVVQSFALIAAALNMMGLFIADVLYILIDPRIRFEAAQR